MVKYVEYIMNINIFNINEYVMRVLSCITPPTQQTLVQTSAMLLQLKQR